MKGRLTHLNALCLCFLIVVNGCDTTSLDEDLEDKQLVCSKDPLPGVLQPLEIGNYWIYTQYRSEARTDTFDYFVTARLDTLFNGKPLTAYTISGNDSITYGRRFSNAEDGLHNNGKNYSSVTVITDKLFRKYPADEGTVFHEGGASFLPNDDSVYDGVEIEVIDTQATIETPAGTFQAYVYRKIIDNGEDVAADTIVDIYYAPGIGRVGYVWRDEFDLELEIGERRLLFDYQLCR